MRKETKFWTKRNGLVERKLALIRGIMHFPFSTAVFLASHIPLLSAFRFISPTRVMIWRYLPWWHTAKRREAGHLPDALMHYGRTSETRKAIVYFRFNVNPRMKIRRLTCVIKFRGEGSIPRLLQFFSWKKSFWQPRIIFILVLPLSKHFFT